MRYTRLKKAVEAGLFKGATLSSKPTATSPQLAALANPESRRLGNAAATGRNQKPRRTTRPRRNAQAKVSASDLEDEEDAQSTSLGGRSRRKRHASNVVSEDDDSEMFYADTSRATRRTKQIKRSDSDIEAEEHEEAEEVEEAEEAEDPDRQDSVASRLTALDRRRARGGSLTQRPQYALQNFDDTTFAGSASRRKASAANAAESAYALSIASGRYAPSPEDDSRARSGHAARLRNTSTGANPIANSGRKPPGTSSAGMRQLNARDRQFLARHGQANRPLFNSPLGQTNPLNDFVPAIARRSSTLDPDNGSAGHMPLPSLSPFEDPDYDADPDNLRPHHTYDVASVFDNFSPPMDVATRFGPSSTKSGRTKRNVPKSHHKPVQHKQADANIDPQLTATPTPTPSSPAPRSRQLPRATKIAPENAQDTTEGPAKSNAPSPQAQSQHSSTRTTRPRSAAPPATATASELEIAEMLQGLKQGISSGGGSGLARSPPVPVPAQSDSNPEQDNNEDSQVSITPSGKRRSVPSSHVPGKRP